MAIVMILLLGAFVYALVANILPWMAALGGIVITGAITLALLSKG